MAVSSAPTIETRQNRAAVLSVAIAGAISLSVGMGIGRFAFTPILPMMLHDGVIDLRSGSWLATANYAGYLAGAMACMILPRAWAASLLVKLGLAATVILTLAMGWYVPALWPALRFLAGVASAAVFRLHVGMVSAAARASRRTGDGRRDLHRTGCGHRDFRFRRDRDRGRPSLLRLRLARLRPARGIAERRCLDRVPGPQSDFVNARTDCAAAPGPHGGPRHRRRNGDLHGRIRPGRVRVYHYGDVSSGHRARDPAGIALARLVLADLRACRRGWLPACRRGFREPSILA